MSVNKLKSTYLLKGGAPHFVLWTSLSKLADMDSLIWVEAHNDYPTMVKISKHLTSITPKSTSKRFFLI